jgi:hypothetical protein
MSFYASDPSLPRRFRLILSSFLQHDDLPFADVLPEQTIQQAFVEAEADFAQDDDAVYTPALTLWAFLSQVLHARELRSCTAAVARVIVLLVALGKEPCSDNTGAYCRARAKLPAAIIRRLTTDIADGCERRLPRRWLWKGRHVHLVDGTTVSMPDTPSNQAAYPQPETQQPGLGFPIARVDPPRKNLEKSRLSARSARMRPRGHPKSARTTAVSGRRPRNRSVLLS